MSSYSFSYESESESSGSSATQREEVQQPTCPMSTGLCRFNFLSHVKPAQLFCMQVTHNEVACGEHLDLKLVLDSVSGHEIAAKKDLKLWMESMRRRGGQKPYFLQDMPPPPPPPAKGKGKGSAGRWQRETPTPQDEIMMLLSLHEGEQRTWAYPMHWIQVNQPFPKGMDKDIAERFFQFRKENELPKMRKAVGTTTLSPTSVGCKSSLLARAIGSDDVEHPQVHFALRALTLSLPEVFFAYREIATSGALYTRWRQGQIIVAPRGRSTRIPPPPPPLEAIGSESATRSVFLKPKEGKPEKGRKKKRKESVAVAASSTSAQQESGGTVAASSSSAKGCGGEGRGTVEATSSAARRRRRKGKRSRNRSRSR